ncbi:MAG TPA: hypothetical protein VFN23_07045 [Ktedonobacteraceae bacterium]|nr:hypothetical protein [Ktedonobacteraceae bacterium]
MPIPLNAKGEIADFLDVSQFVGGRSAYECVAYSAALCFYAGPPEQGPTGTILQASNLAQYWYGREEGGNSASNTNGMSLEAEYDMLRGLNLTYKPLSATIEAVKDALMNRMAVLVCGAETGFYDLDLGDHVPYSWQPSGNHCIVASGITPTGNLLVHDCASIARSGVRPGPRRYDVSKMQLVSATAVCFSWLEGEDMPIDINSPGVGNYFTESDGSHWLCKQTQKVLQYGNLSFYKQENGLKRLGLPVSNEIPLDSAGNTKQYFERGVLFYDPQHHYDNPPGSGSTYYAHLYGGPGEDPIIAELKQQLVQAQQATQNSASLQAIKQIQTIVKPF